MQRLCSPNRADARRFGLLKRGWIPAFALAAVLMVPAGDAFGQDRGDRYRGAKAGESTYNAGSSRSSSSSARSSSSGSRQDAAPRDRSAGNSYSSPAARDNRINERIADRARPGDYDRQVQRQRGSRTYDQSRNDLNEYQRQTPRNDTFRDRDRDNGNRDFDTRRDDTRRQSDFGRNDYRRDSDRIGDRDNYSRNAYGTRPSYTYPSHSRPYSISTRYVSPARYGRSYDAYQYRPTLFRPAYETTYQTTYSRAYIAPRREPGITATFNYDSDYRGRNYNDYRRYDQGYNRGYDSDINVNINLGSDYRRVSRPYYKRSYTPVYETTTYTTYHTPVVRQTTYTTYNGGYYNNLDWSCYTPTYRTSYRSSYGPTYYRSYRSGVTPSLNLNYNSRRGWNTGVGLNFRFKF